MQAIVAFDSQAAAFANAVWRQTSAHSAFADSKAAQRCSYSIATTAKSNARCSKVTSESVSQFLHSGSCSNAAADFCGGVLLKYLQCCGRKRCSTPGHAIRAGTNVEEPMYEDGDLYEAPDAYGGWKGIRKSPLTEAWEKRGKLVTVAGYEWFVVDEGPETGPPKSTILLLPGLPAHSYSFREVIRLLCEAGHRAIGFDWPGFGLSDKPSPKTFGYRPTDILDGLEGLVVALGLEKVTLVAQGFLGGTSGIQYAAAHPDHVAKLVIMNAPLREDCRLPKPFQQMTLPFIGAAFAQDPTRLADLSFNSSGPYEMSEDDLQVYRQPYMESSDAGFAALAAVKNLDLKNDVARCRALLTSDAYRTPTLLTLCSQDKWLSQPSDLIATLNGRPWFSTTVLDGAGHFAQEDWPEKVAAAIRRL
ncbi:hypothetical protein KFL_000540350 [Klebsormidium nitens]|uniref:AB hydrolase-1 domain-containing protein n=1 Tax=Klebsormidium nitens TaxID=105231 RepID=A0A0U9HMG9_KLENI|nr:hypothetical protein KFL_000540350 [Klebsormidium nitens]|eukprot:GAQ80460.1 hypothetical protein KFL_000540350 [Klebsormidium nitens]